MILKTLGFRKRVEHLERMQNVRISKQLFPYKLDGRKELELPRKTTF
jgi:hypothetical protein